MSPPSPSEESGPSGRRVRRLWIVLGSVVLFCVALRVALPYATPPIAGWLAMRQAGLDARIRNVDLEVLEGIVVVEGLWVGPPGRAPEGVAAPDPATALLALDRISLDLAWTELVRGRVNLRAVQLDAPRLRVERLADGTIDPLHGAMPPPPDPEAEARAAAEAEAEAEAEAARIAAGGAPPEPGGIPIVVDDLMLNGAEVRVVEAADGAELLDFQLTELDLRAFSMDGASIGLGGIGVREPKLRAQREFLLDPTKSAGRPVRPAEPAPAAGPAPAGAARGYRVDDLDIERAAFQLMVGEEVVDVALAVKATGATLDSGATFPVDIHVDIGESGTLDIAGEVGAAPPHFVGTVKSDDLPLHLTLMALREDLDEWVKRFRLYSDLDVAFHSVEHDGNAAGLNTKGRVAFTGMEISDPQGQENLSVAWDELEILLHEVAVPMGHAAETTPVRVHVEQVALTAPKMRYRQPSDAIARLTKGPGAAAADAEGPEEPAEPEPGGPPPEIRVDRVEVKQGQVLFRDDNVSPAFEAIVARLNATLLGIDPGAPSVGKVDVDVLMGDGSTIKADGTIGATDGKLDLEVARLRLPPVNPYAAGVGIALKEGELNVTTKIDAEGRHWKIDNDVNLHDLVIDEPASQEFLDSLGMPIGLILSLLRDPTGDIDLPVTVEFDEGKMDTSVGELIAGALRQALVGAATIPLKAMGGLVRAGGGGFELEPIPSAPGAVESVEGTAETFLAMSSLLRERPALAVVLTGRAGDPDVPYLQVQVLADRVAEGGDLPQLDDAAGLIGRQQIKSALKKRAEGEQGRLSPENEAFLERYAAEVEVADERYAALATQRANWVRDALVEKLKVDPARIRVADDAKRGDPGIVVELDSYSPPPADAAAGDDA